MKTKENILDKALRVYDKIKIQVTYAIVLFIAVYELFPIDEFFPQANTIVLVALGFILLEVIFQMYKKLSSLDRFQVFNSGTEMLIKFEEDVMQVKRGKTINLKVITVGSRVYLPSLFNIMNKLIAEKRIFNIEIATLSSDYIEQSEHFNEANVRKFSKAARLSRDQIEAYKEEHEEFFDDTGSSLVIQEYDYVPNYIGILLNDSILYFSHTMWNNGYLVGANNNRYELVSADDKYDGDYKIESFSSWFTFIKSKNEEASHS